MNQEQNNFNQNNFNIQGNKMLSSNEMMINTYDINYIEKIFECNENKMKERIKININDNCFLEINLKEDKVIKEIKIKTSNMNNIIQIFNILSKKGYRIEQIFYDIEDKPYYNKDFSSLESIANNTNLYIEYGDMFHYAIYDEFIGLQETIKWITKIINNTNLSPVEKLMFAYDFMKTFKYKDSQNNGLDSRAPHRILETGNISCGGYTSLLKEIVKNLNVNIKIGEESIECYDDTGNCIDGHSRNIVKIDDSKYNVNGIFVIDPTYDSVKEFNDVNYSSLDLYQYFLIPAEDYPKMFPDESIPTLFELYLNGDLDDSKKYFLEDDEFDLRNLLNKTMEKEEKVIKKSLYESALEALLNETMEEEEIKKYLSASRPSFKQFKEMLYNVRIAEGFSKEEAIKDVTKVVRFNANVINEINDEYGLNMSFFEERKTK